MKKANLQSHKILVFGNPMVKIDSMPFKIMADLRERFPDIEFKGFDPNDDLEKEGDNLNIIDTVEGIDKVTLITNIDSIKINRIITMHDFDLGYSLKMLKKIGYIKNVKIFGIPMKIRKKEVLDQLTTMIKANLS